MNKKTITTIVTVFILSFPLPFAVYYFLHWTYGISFDAFIGSAYDFYWAFSISILLDSLTSRKKLGYKIGAMVLFGVVLPIVGLVLIVFPFIPVAEQPMFVAEVAVGVVFGASLGKGIVVIHDQIKKQDEPEKT